MATKQRKYKPDTPYLLTQRFGNGVQWLDCPTLRKQLIRLIILAAARANVAVLAFFLVGNHVHLILAQRRRGARHLIEGIAPFMRNVFAVFCRVVVMRHVERKRGHVVQRRYDHQELGSAGDLMRALAYVHGQVEHHQLQGVLEDVLGRSSRGAVVGQEPDGVVNSVIEHGLDAEQLEALLIGTIERACAAERQPDSEPFAWRTALEDTGADLAARGVLSEQQRSELCGAASPPRAIEWGEVASFAHARRRQARLEAGVIGPHFMLLQQVDADNRVRSVTAYRGRPAEEEGEKSRAVRWEVEAVIDVESRPDPAPPPNTR